MGSLAKGWTKVAFGDVVRLSKTRSADPAADGFDRYVGLDHLDSGDLRVRRWGETSDGTTFTSVFKPGQVLFGKRRAYQRKVAVADFDGVCSGDIYVLEPNDHSMLPELFPFVCQTDAFFDHAVGTSAGSLSPRTNWKSLATFEFCLPSLIEEQRRLAAALMACDKARETLEDLEKCGRVVQSSLFERTFANTPRVARLADLLSRDIQYGSSTRANSDKRGVPMLRIPNVLRGHLDLTDLKWVELPQAETNRYSVSEGDILVVRTNGNPEYVARGTAIPQLSERTVFASYLMRLTPDAGKTTSSFLAGALSTPRMRWQLAPSIRSSAGNFNINAQDLGNLEIPWPEMQDQRALEDCLAPVAEAQESIAARQTSHGRVKACLLQTLTQEAENA